jgi:hypothetical protein
MLLPNRFCIFLVVLSSFTITLFSSKRGLYDLIMDSSKYLPVYGFEMVLLRCEWTFTIKNSSEIFGFLVTKDRMFIVFYMKNLHRNVLVIDYDTCLLSQSCLFSDGMLYCIFLSLRYLSLKKRYKLFLLWERKNLFEFDYG